MKEFSERLKELRTEKGLSAMKLAKEIGVSDASVIRWEQGLRVPSIDNLKAVAEYFGVSADYLIGLED